MKIEQYRHTSQRLLWFCMLGVITALILVVLYTNSTLRSIEKNLPNTLLTELNSLSLVLDELSEVVSSARIASATENPAHVEQLRTGVEIVYHSIVELRDTFVTNNLVNASAFHAVVAPAIADLKIWLIEGISGYEPESQVTLDIVETRISKAYQKASQLQHESQEHAQSILNIQLKRLENFQFAVITLFAISLVVVCCLIYLLFRQTSMTKREIETKDEFIEQHDLLENLLENLPLGIAVWDKNKRIVHFNNSFTDITGYARADMAHLNKWPQLAYPDPEYQKQVKEHWKKVGGREPVTEYVVTCKDGARKDVEFRTTYLPDSRIINTLTDVTERNKNEKILRETRKIKARSRKMESLGLLAGGVAHDLNNILSGIVSYPELILMDLSENHRLRKGIEIIRDSGQKATAIVQDLLTVARGVAIAKEPLNLNAMIENYLKSPDFNLLQKFHPDITVQLSLDENILNIQGSQVHIQKILMNLVSNGCEAIMNQGSVHISTKNSYVDTPFRGYDNVQEGEYVVLSVADQGTGISDEDLERIFEPFYSKKVMGRSGTGLGLAVVWNVVQDHNGYIDVSSSDDGTTFDIYLPATRQASSVDEPLPDLETLKGNGEFILVVDDVEAQREISSSIVEKLGYRVETVSSGEEAITFLKTRTADLLLLDMIMDPGMNGRQTYEEILEIHPAQRAIIISGFAETEEVKETLRLGASCYLKKPLNIRLLGISIHKVIYQ